MNEKLAEAILEQMGDAVIFAAPDGTIARWNRAATRLFGFEPADVIGQSLDVIIPERLRAAHWKGFDAAVAQGRLKLDGRPTLTRATHAQGAKLYVEMTFALVADPDSGLIAGAVAVARQVDRPPAPSGHDPAAVKLG